MKYFFVLLFLAAFPDLQAQQKVSGMIADSLTGESLPFATIRTGEKGGGIITDIHGKFTLTLPASASHISVSYVGYKAISIPVEQLKQGRTIFLSPAGSLMNEVIIRPNHDKIREIINKAIQNRSLHNPEQYDQYECNVYYKMKVDLIPYFSREDSARGNITMKEKKASDLDSIRGFLANNHLILSETYSKRIYRKPEQVQEVLLASKFSGLEKTYFANIITDAIPFHVYKDYINLNGKDYVNPIAKGWRNRYNFRLEDELLVGNDTVYLLSFSPKPGKDFNSLTGNVYINSNGYAISHIICRTAADSERIVELEQIYTMVGGRWFPKELNYEFRMRGFPANNMQVISVGHSNIDSVGFELTNRFGFNKSRPVTLHDSVDLRTPGDWQQYRGDSLSAKEHNTYKVIDSFSKANHIEQLVVGTSRLTIGRLPVGKFEIDVNRVISSNKYEGTRLGLGLYTSDKVSRYFSLGGWFGYGTRDRNWKYGASTTLYPLGDKDNWIGFSYQEDYSIPGAVNLHPELDKKGLRRWLLVEVDKVKEYAINANMRKSYWEFSGYAAKKEVKTCYEFNHSGKLFNDFNIQEGSIGLRYAYGEKRTPMFEYYLPGITKYPVLYLKLGKGKISSGEYSTDFTRLQAAVTFTKRINRWGNENFRLEAGLIKVPGKNAIPRSLLMAGNGYNVQDLNYYAFGGFITMKPFEYFSDRYMSFLYRHDFNKYLWNTKLSKPFISLAHNMAFGNTSEKNLIANPGIKTIGKGYHESGILLNQVLRVNLKFADAYLNVGAFYHWEGSFNWERNGGFVVGVSFGM